jgi:hypothetical protein
MTLDICRPGSQALNSQGEESTPASIWQALTGTPITDELQPLYAMEGSRRTYYKGRIPDKGEVGGSRFKSTQAHHSFHTIS